MSLYRVQTVIHTTDAIPANFVTNTMTFDILDDAPGDFATAAPKLANALEAFYRGFQTRLSSKLELTGHEFKYYKLSDPTPRPPVLLDTWALTGKGGTALPSENAVVLSWQASKVAGLIQASRRNRIYLGPWALTAHNGTTGLIEATTITEITTAASLLIAQGIADGDWDLVVYSPKLNQGYDFADGWCDNAWDTQRRRGVEATVRTTWV